MKKFSSFRLAMASFLSFSLILPIFSSSIVAEEKEDIPTIYVEGFAAMRNTENRQSASDEAFKEIQNKIIEDIGVRVEPVFMPAGVEKEKLGLRIASQTEPLDMIMTGNWREYLKHEQIIPIDEYLPTMDNLKEVYPLEDEAVWNSLKDNEGKHYGFPRAVPTTSYPIWIRQDWLDKYKLEQPKTVDDLENILKVFKENDPAGNGKTIPLLVNIAGLNMGFSGGFTDKGYGAFYDKDKQSAQVGILQEGYKDAVAKIADWYQKGYIHPDSFSAKNDDYKTWLTSNRVGATMLWYSLVAINEPLLKEVDPEANYVYSPQITGPKGLIQTQSKPSEACLMILKKSQNPEACAKFANWLCNTDNYISSYLGVEGKDWHYSDKEKNYVVRDDETRYGGEFYVYPNNGMLKKYVIMPDDQTTKPDNYNHYLTEGSYRYEDCKKPGDYQVINYIDILDDLAPNRNDMQTMLDIELTNFLTGQRPMEEWESFIEDELRPAGLDDLNNAETELFKLAGITE